MSIHLKKAEGIDAQPTDRLHYIPAKVNKDSVADVENYFEQFTEKIAEGTDFMQNSLRGRPVVGVKMDVPEGWQGVVYVERKRPLAEDADRVLQQKTTFNNLTFWNYDKNPSRNDAFAQALQWLEISDVLHTPETPDNS